MAERDDYSEAWNTPATDANAKPLKVLQDQSNAAAVKLADEFETAYQAANQDTQP